MPDISMKSEQKKAERILGLFSSGLSAVATFYFTDIGLHMRSIFLFWASASGGRIGLYIQTISSSFSFIGQHVKLILRKVFLLLSL